LYDQSMQYAPIAPDGEVVNPTSMRLIRLLKMLKLLRMIRLMKMFRELRLMIASILASMKPMVWAMMVIAIIAYIFGIVFLQAVTNYLIDYRDELPDDEAKALTEFWGSLGTSMLSLYMSSVGGESWRYVAKPLWNVGMVYYLMFLVYIAFFMFVIVNTLTSLFIETMIENASQDHAMVVHHELAKKAKYVEQLEEIFSNMDADGSGTLGYEEVCECFADPSVMAFATSLGIPSTEMAQFWTLISDAGKADVDIDSFVSGCMKLRGAAKSIDLVTLMQQNSRGHREGNKMIKQLQAQLEEIRGEIKGVASKNKPYGGHGSKVNEMLHPLVRQQSQ